MRALDKLTKKKRDHVKVAELVRMSVEHSRPEMLSPNRQVNIENSKTSNHHNSSLSSVSSLSPKNAANNLKMMLMSPNKNVNFDSIASSAGSVASSSANSTNSSNVVVVANTNPMKTSMGDLDLQKLPANIKFELDQLELELLEGDITQKGYDKKRARLLEGYLKSLHAPHLNSNDAKTDTKSKEKIRIYRKRNKEDVSTNRYHSGKFITLFCFNHQVVRLDTCRLYFCFFSHCFKIFFVLNLVN